MRDDGRGYGRLEYEVDGFELGLKRAAPEDLRGGTPEENAATFLSVLQGERGARRDFVLLNAAAGLVVAGITPDVAAGIELAGSLIDDGAPARTLEALARVSSEVRAQGEQG